MDQLCGVAAKSHIQIIQRFQNKLLRIITNAAWYINDRIPFDLNTPMVIDELRRYSSNYMRHIVNHSNTLARALLLSDGSIGRLKRYQVTDPSTRFE